MNDRELLELAAKAFWGEEIDDVCSIRWGEQDSAILYIHGDNQDHNGQDRERVWNPLDEDGDALRLAVKVRLLVNIDRSSVKATDGLTTEAYEVTSPDPYAATRRAIVRAAAELGRTAP